jgi:hypothetical protein
MSVDANRLRRVWHRPGRFGSRAPVAEAERGVGGVVVVLESSFRVAACPFPLPSPPGRVRGIPDSASRPVHPSNAEAKSRVLP